MPAQQSSALHIDDIDGFFGDAITACTLLVSLPGSQGSQFPVWLGLLDLIVSHLTASFHTTAALCIEPGVIYRHSTL